MKPPIFVWTSGSLDAFDTIADLEDRYSADALADDDFALYDSSGRILKASAGSDGSTRISCDRRQPPDSEKLTALLRAYLERGGMATETARSLTLAELVQEVYPSSEPSSDASRREKSRRPSAQWPDSNEGIKRLVDAFGLAVVGGAVAACIGFWFAVMYYRSLSSTGYGDLGEALIGLYEAAIASALVAGINVFLGVLLRFDLFQTETGKTIGCAFIALIAILVLVGGVVATAFVLLCG